MIPTYQCKYARNGRKLYNFGTMIRKRWANMQDVIHFLSGWILILAMISCSGDHRQDQPAEDSRAQEIIDLAISAAGGEVLDQVRVSFNFRDRHYVATRQEGKYHYERIFRDSMGLRVHDHLTNEGLWREVAGEKVVLSMKDSAAYANSVNSVIYFALLPYFLNDPAVIKTYLGVESIGGKEYEKIKVTFQQEGGGKDFEDEFIYWFAGDTYHLDFLAYNYITDGGGARFREAYNARQINGVRFVDYTNYKPITKSRKVAHFAQWFGQDSLVFLSRIVLDSVEVQPL